MTDRWAKRHARFPETFWARVDMSGGPDACWPWMGARHTARPQYPYVPYGVVNYMTRRTYAHRIAYLLSTGVAPGAGVVMHSCDNPPCCNPAHLSLGTKAENMADMIAKGRYKAWRAPVGAIR